jgi:hypothetical protein
MAHPSDLDALIREPSFQRMWARPHQVVLTHHIPDTGGYSVAGDRYYIDRDFAAAVHLGAWTDPRTGDHHVVAVRGMAPQQIIDAVILHERIEKCMLDADNPINDYVQAHEYATCGEHRAVRAAGASPAHYEHAIRPLIQYNERKPLAEVPLDLDCEPYLDHPDAEDRRALEAMRNLGVVDAGKIGKVDVRYARSTGRDRCESCAGWMGPRPAELSPCRKISGLVRRDMWCSKYSPMRTLDGAAHAKWRST